MKKRILIGFTALIVLSIMFAFTYKPFEWEVQSEGASIKYKMPDEGQEGEFKKMKATIKFDPLEPLSSTFYAEVDVNSLDAGSGMKTKHLKSDDFFHAEKYPTITFNSTSIQKTDTGLVVIGTLKVKDTENKVNIPFKFANTSQGKGTFVGTLKVHTAQLGLTHKSIKSQKKQEIKENVIISLNVPVSTKN